MVHIEIHFCLIGLYKDIFLKKINFIEASKNCNLYGFSHHVYRIKKLKARKQINNFVYVLLVSFNFLKNRLKNCNKFHLLWKLFNKRGKESLYHFVVGDWKEVKL